MFRFLTAVPILALLLTIAPMARADPDAVMKAMDGFRREIPPPQGLDEMNGASLPDADGKSYPDSHLRGVASRMGAKTKADCMVLLTYLTDRDPKMRRIAAFALEGVVKAYPNGFPSDSLDKLDSDQHRKMVKAFVAGIMKDDGVEYDGVDYQKMADSASWEWHPEQASVLYSTMLCPKEYQVEIIRPPNALGHMTIRFSKDDRLLCTIDGQAYTTYLIDEGVLYYAAYDHDRSGCSLVAYDLKAEKQLWKSQLEGIGPISHSRYSNLVVVQGAPGATNLSPRVILVRGNESAGKYIEYVDAKTGKTIGRKVFEKGFKDTGPMEPR